MKKVLILAAAMLPCSLAFCQEADETLPAAEVTLVSRLDLNPYFCCPSARFDFDHGNSTINALFEGTFSDLFSCTVATHFIQSGGDYGWPYYNLGRSDSVNFLDYFQGDFSLGNWTLSAGKLMMKTGGFEFDDYWDWETFYGLSSALFFDLPSYQWGVNAAWTTPSEMSEFSLQAVTSPFGKHPFRSNLWACSAGWRGEYDWFSNLVSVSAVEYEKGKFDYIYAVGARAEMDDMTFTLDWNNNCGIDFESPVSRFVRGNALQFTAKWMPSDRYALQLMSTWTSAGEYQGWRTGLVFQFFPLKESSDLRLHAYAMYDSGMETITMNAGILYNLHLKLFR